MCRSTYIASKMDYIREFDIKLEKEMFYAGEILAGFVILDTVENFKLRGKYSYFIFIGIKAHTKYTIWGRAWVGHVSSKLNEEEQKCPLVFKPATNIQKIGFYGTFSAIRVVLRGKAHTEWKVMVSGERRTVKDDQYFIDDRAMIWGKGKLINCFHFCVKLCKYLYFRFVSLDHSENPLGNW